MRELHTVTQVLKNGVNEIQDTTHSAHLDCELLLCYVLQCSREELIRDAQKELTPQQVNQFHSLITKRKHHIPIAYLVKSKEFYGRNFYVNKNVLIPKPETETLVEQYLDWMESNFIHENFSLVEIGIGSGALLITCALELQRLKNIQLKSSTFIGVDISQDALSVAQKNIDTYKLHDHITLIESDLLKDVQKYPNPIFLANLPYVDRNDEISNETHHEPSVALYSENKGLKHITDFLNQSVEHKPKAIFLEMAPWQVDTIIKEASTIFQNTNIQSYGDLSGKKRGVIIDFRPQN